VERYCSGGLAADEKMAHTHCMLDTQDYKYTLRICNNYGFSTETMVQELASRTGYTYMACLVEDFLTGTGLYLSEFSCGNFVATVMEFWVYMNGKHFKTKVCIQPPEE
jgi:hypothetical protein